MSGPIPKLAATYQHLEHAGAHRYAPAIPSCRVLLLGEDNPQSADPRHALYPYPEGCAGHRLATRILDLSTGSYMSIWRTNLCNPRWSTPAARERAKLLVDPVVGHPWKVIVMLGRKVADAVCRALDMRDSETGKPVGIDAFDSRTIGWRIGEVEHKLELVALPHPSGRSLVYNDFKMRESARRLVALHAPELWPEPSISGAVQ